ncbi:MAG: DoxX family membrane protein [Leptospiraceae bacterium]|nr:DoxX family membrane protein [Leptospiraceae bacterium]
MKIAVIVVRWLMGALFIFASVAYLFKLITPPEQMGAMKVFNDGLEASIYMMPTVKVIELICGIMFLSGRFVPLATVVIAPIIVNILLVHLFLDMQGLPVGIFLVFANSFLAYNHRESYKTLFVAK